MADTLDLEFSDFSDIDINEDLDLGLTSDEDDDLSHAPPQRANGFSSKAAVPNSSSKTSLLTTQSEYKQGDKKLESKEGDWKSADSTTAPKDSSTSSSEPKSNVVEGPHEDSEAQQSNSPNRMVISNEAEEEGSEMPDIAVAEVNPSKRESMRSSQGSINGIPMDSFKPSESKTHQKQVEQVEQKHTPNVNVSLDLLDGDNDDDDDDVFGEDDDMPLFDEEDTGSEAGDVVDEDALWAPPPEDAPPPPPVLSDEEIGESHTSTVPIINRLQFEEHVFQPQTLPVVEEHEDEEEEEEPTKSPKTKAKEDIAAPSFDDNGDADSDLFDDLDTLSLLSGASALENAKSEKDEANESLPPTFSAPIQTEESFIPPPGPASPNPNPAEPTSVLRTEHSPKRDRPRSDGRRRTVSFDIDEEVKPSATANDGAFSIPAVTYEDATTKQENGDKDNNNNNDRRGVKEPASAVPSSSWANMSNDITTTPIKKEKKAVKHQPDLPLFLDLSYKTLNEITPILKKNPQLRALVLSHCSLDYVPSLPEHLEELDLSYNNLDAIQGMEHLAQLRVLNLDNNSIGATAGLELCPRLRQLALSNNRIRAIEHLEHIRSLRTLDLRGNSISSFQSIRTLSLNANLESLLLIGNPISEKSGYRVKVTNFLPALVELDGINAKKKADRVTSGASDTVKGGSTMVHINKTPVVRRAPPTRTAKKKKGVVSRTGPVSSLARTAAAQKKSTLSSTGPMKKKKAVIRKNSSSPSTSKPSVHVSVRSHAEPDAPVGRSKTKDLLIAMQTLEERKKDLHQVSIVVCCCFLFEARCLSVYISHILSPFVHYS